MSTVEARARTRPRIASAWSIALQGITGAAIEIEALIAPGLPRTVMVGLPDTAVYEARDRCRAAVTASGLGWPAGALTINLTPASLPKAGSHHDLAICAAVLAAAGVVPPAATDRVVLLGEVGLDGRVRTVHGVLPATSAAQRLGYQDIIVPFGQGREARLVRGMNVRTVASLAELVDVLRGHRYGEEAEPAPAALVEARTEDFSDVLGQLMARYAAEVAAAGRHHMLMTGPAGVGKTLIAARLPGILPPLDTETALQVAAIRSLLGEQVTTLDLRPPFADPHPSTPLASLVGGGARLAQPGAISRAHGGVLFLDEAAELRPGVLDALRVPLETGEIVLSRLRGEVRYPARFQLVMALNPCPCGNHGVPDRRCDCTPTTVRRYRQRISGPVRDRVDITVAMQAITSAAMTRYADHHPPEASATIAERVREARARQLARLAGTPWRTNAEVPGPHLRRHAPLSHGVEALSTAVDTGQLSHRGVDAVRRLSWTVADLAGRDAPAHDDVAMAIALRRGTDHDQRS